jgi:hypothetical protein
MMYYDWAVVEFIGTHTRRVIKDPSKWSCVYTIVRYFETRKQAKEILAI